MPLRTRRHPLREEKRETVDDHLVSMINVAREKASVS
jgi:hypothetical protein